MQALLNRLVLETFVNLFLLCCVTLFRLVPSLFAVSVFYATVYDNIGSGPLWSTMVSNEKSFCVDNWWTNVLFLGNYINTERSCVFQTWYIHCDFQLFVITAFIFFILKNRAVFVKSFVVATILCCSAINFYIIWRWNLDPFPLLHKRIWLNVRSYNNFKLLYIKPTHRAIPYLIGFLVGYEIHLRKPNKWDKRQTRRLLISGFLLGLVTFCSASIFSDPRSYSINSIYSAIFSTAVPYLWAIANLLVIVSVVNGALGSLTKFFSWKGFIPFSKLTYNVFLLHMILQIHDAASKRSSSYLRPTDWYSRTMLDIVVSYTMALVLYVLVEAPCRYTMKYLTSSAQPNLSTNDTK